jgi:5-methylcytosine-specific restriction endonuclease McrA
MTKATSEPTIQIVSREEARSAGVNRFFTGISCFRGHQCERLVSNGLCIECARLNKADDRARNPDRERARKKRYLASLDPEEEKAKARGRYAKYKHRLKKKNPETFKRWRLANLDEVKRTHSEYKKSNRDRFRAYDRNRRAQKSGSAGKHTAKEIRELYERQHGRCAACKCAVAFKKKHVDHIVPLCAGGGNDISNLQILCAPCNLSKGTKDPIIWARQLGRLV